MLDRDMVEKLKKRVTPAQARVIEHVASLSEIVGEDYYQAAYASDTKEIKRRSIEALATMNIIKITYLIPEDESIFMYELHRGCYK